MKRVIAINFAKPVVPLTAYISMLERAIKFANCNLYKKYRIEITGIEPNELGFVLITVEVPDTVEFNNRHLKGLSAYFLRSEDAELFKGYRQGMRLFTYFEVQRGANEN